MGDLLVVSAMSVGGGSGRIHARYIFAISALYVIFKLIEGVGEGEESLTDSNLWLLQQLQIFHEVHLKKSIYQLFMETGWEGGV